MTQNKSTFIFCYLFSIYSLSLSLSLPLYRNSFDYSIESTQVCGIMGIVPVFICIILSYIWPKEQLSSSYWAWLHIDKWCFSPATYLQQRIPQHTAKTANKITIDIYVCNSNPLHINYFRCFHIFTGNIQISMTHDTQTRKINIIFSICYCVSGE